MSTPVRDIQAASEQAAERCPRTNVRRSGLSLPLAVSLLGFVGWYAAFTILRPELVGDERHHVPAIQAAARGDWSLVRELPMPLTYHWLAVWATRTVGPELWALRAFQTFWTLLAIVLYHTAAKVYRPDYSSRDLYRFAWHPLIVAFGALVCTDITALVGILIALNFHLRRRYIPAALGLAGALLIRQSNVVWVAYFLAWSLMEVWLKASTFRNAPSVRTPVVLATASFSDWFKRVAAPQLRCGAWAYLAVFAGGAVAVALAGRGVLLARAMSNYPEFNPAVFYLLALAAALLWLPIWLARLAEFWPRRLAPALMRAWKVALLVAAVAVLALEYRNPHPWNMDLDFPHNWPLYAMVMFAGARVVLAVVIVAFVIACVLDAARSPERRFTALTWAFTLAFLIPHNLADLRYYIVPLVLLDFLTPRAPAEGRILAAWHLALSLAVAGLLAFQLGGVSGML